LNFFKKNSIPDNTVTFKILVRIDCHFFLSGDLFISQLSSGWMVFYKVKFVKILFLFSKITID